MKTRAILAGITFALAPLAASAGQNNIDAMFAQWNKPATPGAVLAVIKDGKIVRRGAYGMADIERAAPNTAATRFHVASVSKQFTAFAIYLLAQDGKLALDDDVRKYLPELHDFGAKITIRQLIHHTSGLRDQWALLGLAGWRLEDVITEDDVMRLVRAQRSLNFAPGREHLYCNTGYTLLGIIVKRVSGKSLPAFAKERMFDPLGMTNTHFKDDYQALVPGRASSYDLPAGGPYRYLALSYSNVGATSLSTTVDDLALWDQNFYDGKVGGKQVLAQMQTRGKLNNGREISYAGGVVMGSHKGEDTVEHSGGDAGYRADFVRFPKKKLSVIVLSNAADFNAGRMSREVADVYLGHSAAPAPVAPKAYQEITLAPAQLDAMVGDYALNPSFVVSFMREEGRLMTQATGQPKLQVFPYEERGVFLKVVDAQFIFDAPDKNGVIQGGTLHQNGRKTPARRVQKVVLSAQELDQRSGTFYSEELNVIYKVSQKDGALVLHHPRADLPLSPSSANAFAAAYPVGRIEYHCDARGCNSFKVSNGRVRNLAFTKVMVTPVAPPAALLPAFARAPAFVRGSMNNWGTGAQMQGDGKVFTAKLALDKGVHEFKIGSEDFAEIDFGGMENGKALALGEARKLEAVGANLKLDVPAKGSYVFSLDASNAEAPVLTVRQ